MHPWCTGLERGPVGGEGGSQAVLFSIRHVHYPGRTGVGRYMFALLVLPPITVVPLQGFKYMCCGHRVSVSILPGKSMYCSLLASY